MACGCKKNKETSRGTSAKSSRDVSQYAYKTPRQLRLMQQQAEQEAQNNKTEE